MAQKRYDVVPNGSAWRVTHQQATVSDHETKAAAVDTGFSIARANQPSQLVIHCADGTIEDERTYGDDPFPPRG